MAGRETGPASEPDWRRLNRANWDERAAVHLGPRGYDLTDLRGGRGRLPIVDDELGSVAGLRVLHLQCHIGTDTLALAQRGAEVVGLDFSVSAIAAARGLAAELGLSERVRFVQADLLRRAGGNPRAGRVRPGVRDMGNHLLAPRSARLGEGSGAVPQAWRDILLRRGTFGRAGVR